MKKIIIDVQHMGKPHNPLDRGAKNNNMYEADLVLEYAKILFRKLMFYGYHPFLVTSDYYGQRAAFSNRIGADLYLACHLNSSEKPPTNHYSLVEISQYSSDTTKLIAEEMRKTFEVQLPVDSSKVETIMANERGWSCINRVRAPALLLEPVFINHPHGFFCAMDSAVTIAGAIVGAINWSLSGAI